MVEAAFMKILKVLAALGCLWLLFVGCIFWQMHQPPAKFASTMSKMPGPAMMLFPFETLWTRARAGSVVVGDPAPDFRLPTLDKKSEVTLASLRGSKPVVLVFGSYT
jgi:hypothetical protein